MGAGVAGIALSTVLAAPIAVALEVAALGCGLLGVGCKFVSCKLASKAKKHDEIRVLAESKLNTNEPFSTGTQVQGNGCQASNTYPAAISPKSALLM